MPSFSRWLLERYSAPVKASDWSCSLWRSFQGFLKCYPMSTPALEQWNQILGKRNLKGYLTTNKTIVQPYYGETKCYKTGQYWQSDNKNGCYYNRSKWVCNPTVQLSCVGERLELPKRRFCLCYKISDLAVLHLVAPAFCHSRWSKVAEDH